VTLTFDLGYLWFLDIVTIETRNSCTTFKLVVNGAVIIPVFLVSDLHFNLTVQTLAWWWYDLASMCSYRVDAA